MAEAVWKFPLMAKRQEVEMPKDAKLLCVQEQHGMVCLWALCDIEKPAVKEVFYTFGTGDEIANPERLEYVGTVQQQDGMLVWHVFKVLHSARIHG